MCLCFSPRVHNSHRNCARHAEASTCRAVIRAARGVVSDIGETAAEASSGLIELSRCTLSNSERDVEQVSRKYNLQLPVPIREIQKSPGVRYSGNFHVIALESWLQFIIDHNVWHMLLGLHNADPKRERALLREFWRLYRLAEPDHQVWAEIEKHGIKVEHLLPVVMHGDEGRGRKRGPFLVTSYHSMIGFGTVLANANRKTKSYLQLRLNYVGSTHSSRMITGCLPKMHKDEQALEWPFNFHDRRLSQIISAGRHWQAWWTVPRCLSECSWRLGMAPKVRPLGTILFEHSEESIGTNEQAQRDLPPVPRRAFGARLRGSELEPFMASDDVLRWAVDSETRASSPRPLPITAGRFLQLRLVACVPSWYGKKFCRFDIGTYHRSLPRKYSRLTIWAFDIAVPHLRWWAPWTYIHHSADEGKLRMVW